ncbi:MAG: hypothetical protein CMO80_11225 [Verrucomicrobiales bacterium]|nr:hypothetical protein [Verrucomicrobiales bacterium]|tara:strand:+ start:1190 stop:1618 length:429 start_codon:yes stop_codon:yes gene_type:complete
MTGLPHAQALVWYDVDVNRLEEMVLQLEPRDHAQTVQIDNLRGNRRARPTILDSNPNAFFPFIDSRVTDRMYGARMNQAGHLPILDDLVSDQEKKKQAAAREKAAGETWKTEFFKKHPQADANKDGKLTWYELQSFQKKTGN